MRICTTLLAVTLGVFLPACGDDDDVDLPGDIVGEPDAAPLDETPDAGDVTVDAAPAVDAVPGTPDAAPMPDAPPAVVSFSADIVPILLSRCGGCHLKDVGGAGGLSLGMNAEFAYTALVDEATVLPNPACMGKKRVDSGKPDQPMESSLYEKLVGTSCGKQMPAGMNATPLPPEQIELFARWIQAGAPNN